MSAGSFQSLTDFYSKSPYAHLPREVRAGGSVPVEFVKADQQAHDSVVPALPQLLLILSLSSDMPFRWDLGDGFTPESRYRTGHMKLTPPNTEIALECGGDHSVLILCFSSADAARCLDEEGLSSLDVFGPLHDEAVFKDDHIRRAAIQMWAESLKHDRASVLLIDGLFQTILGRLLRLAGMSLTAKSSRITPVMLQQIDAYIDAHCSTRLKTVDLAALTNLSPFQFTRSFQTTTGFTPHAYVIARRIDRACDLLASSVTTSLAEIAYDCGFSSQAHMTTVFREKLGVTPGQYCSEVCGRFVT